MTSLSEVTTSDGKVRGRVERGVLRWRSIPYAAPPVGDLRLRAPQPVQPWTGFRDATRFRNAAVQHRKGSATGIRKFQSQSEDCLTLNVTAPLEPGTSPRPVMVFIHGGGYVLGTSAVELYSGIGLVKRGDVIVVSMNYRLGALGYVDFTQFSTPERPFDSNLGLRDQVAALQWVQRNIATFGGDPDNVTIFGESAGATAVTTLLATPAAGGLFHRAIAESSPVDWAIDSATATRFASRCIEALGARPETANEVLSTVEPYELFRAGMKLSFSGLRETPGFFPMVPVVDGSYLPKSPLEALADGSAHKVPLIIGTTRDEGTLFAKFADDLPTNPSRITKLLAQTDPAAAAALLATYPGYPAKAAAVALGGDYIFWRPTVEACESHSAHAPTYSFRYDFVPQLFRRIGLGAPHASEMFAVFGFGNTRAGRALTAMGGRRGLREVTDQVQSHWLSFARDGAPLTSWPAYTTQNRKTLIFNTRSRVVDDVNRERRLAWATLRTPKTPAPDDATNKVAG